MLEHPLLRNHPDVESIEWRHLDKETYIEVENILTDGVKLFDAFLVEDFYPQDMFDELVSICTSNDLTKLDYSHQMNKWEEGVQVPQKFFDYAETKIRYLLGTEDIIHAYHMYAHHQITSDGRVPKLGLHIDEAPGPYMIDLHIGGNRDWGFVSRYTNFVCKPNQAVICQPQFEYHYRPSWGSKDPNEYYQAFFMHMINKNHWAVPSDANWGTRSKELEEKYEFGQAFRASKTFAKFNDQRNFIFRDLYIKTHKNTDAPPIPWSEMPLGEDMHIHQRKGVKPAI